VKGIVLAGGSGSRLYPMSLATSKQLMPVYDKPMIYYPISTLMLAGIREILIITTEEHQSDFQRLLGSGDNWGVSFTYKIQPEPKGIAEAFLLGESFIDGEACALILGDNLFYGSGLGESLRARTSSHDGALIFCQEVQDPERYGVVEIAAGGEVVSIEEKPAKAKSNLAATGLYFFDAQVVAKAKTLRPSSRGELEISDLNNLYLDEGKLEAEVLQRGAVWLDTGTVDSLNSAAEFVRVIQERQGFKIGAPEEVAWRMGYISSEQLGEVAKSLPKSDYREYLISLLSR
jgi:glucose-1-phosphate thymidylyltransferase